MAGRFIGIVVVSQDCDERDASAAEPIVLADSCTVPDQRGESGVAA